VIVPVFGVPQSERKKKVCWICGLLITAGEPEVRQLSHLEGKQHNGYQLIRDKIEELKVCFFRIHLFLID
jgi:hypothetical protein